ncbi:putative reverse transcriptase domain-containing protein [Tanacetum coccineum]
MRQIRWIELFSDYDCEICYHPGKANVVADALNRKGWMKPRRAQAMSMTIHSSIKAKILEAQSEASKEVNTPAKMLQGLDKQFERKEDGGLYFIKRIWVPAYGNLRTLIMNEAYATKYSVHLRADKMYYDLRDLYWWPGMKKDIALLETTDKIVQIKERLKTVRDRQKSYADNRRKPLEFGGDKIVERVGPIAYRLRLPQELVGIHDTFHVSNLKKWLANVNLHVPLEEINIDDKLHFVEEPIRNLDCEVKKLK